MTKYCRSAIVLVVFLSLQWAEAWLSTSSTASKKISAHVTGGIGTRIPWQLCSTSSTDEGRPQFQQAQHSRSNNGKNNRKKKTQNPSGGSKFAQPAFSQSKWASKGARNSNNKNGNEGEELSQPKKHHKTPNKFGADSSIASRHAQRLKTAGREGTKRYQNPNKVFLGNLNFTVTDADLAQYLSDQFAIPPKLLLKQCKVVRDWKTHESKGYGFAVFSEPIYATVCLEKLQNKPFRGRKLNVQPGYKATPDPQIFIEQKRQKRLAREAAGLLDEDKEEERPKMDPMEAMMLRQLDPDLVDEEDVAVMEFVADETQVDMKDEELFGSDDEDDDLFDDEEDDDDDVDGFWMEESQPSTLRREDGEEEGQDLSAANRKKRREMARKRRKKIVSNKGFG